MSYLPKKPAFTLAELLIALAILGVIATFTIPKILDTGSNNQYSAMGKEVAGVISEAYQNYKRQNGATASTGSADLTPFINYVRVDTTTTIDNNPSAGDLLCAGNECLLLHNGGMLWYNPVETFNETASTNAVLFVFDPDGQASANESVKFFLDYNGRLTDISNVLTNTQSSVWTHNPCPACEAPWFSWSN